MLSVPCSLIATNALGRMLLPCDTLALSFVAAAALQNKRIRGAGLDVFATEPLPADSPLWGLPNVFMSPHNADRTKEFQFESMELFVQNVERYMSGQELMNVCDKRSGY